MPRQTAPGAGGPPATAGGGRPGGLKGALKGRNGAILAAGGTVGVIALLTLLRGKSSQPAAAAAGTQQAFDSTPYDLYDQWQQQFEQLQGEINQLQQPPGATSPPVQTPVPITKPTPLPAPVPHPPVVKPPVRVSPPPPSKAVSHKTVVVRHGDTLSGIAAKNHISMATLKKLNPVYWTNAKYKQGNRIFAGDKVHLS